MVKIKVGKETLNTLTTAVSQSGIKTKGQLKRFLTTGASTKQAKSLNKKEIELVERLDQLQLFEKILPLLTYLKDTGDVEGTIKNSAALAAAQLIVLLKSANNEKVKYAVAKDLLDRALGKAVDRSISLTQDLDKMSEKELDALIATAVSEVKRVAEEDVKK